MRAARALLPLALLAGCLGGGPAATDAQPCVRVDVATDRATLAPGEDATVTARATNCGAAPIALAWSACLDGPLVATIAWNGTTWVLRARGAAADPAVVACPVHDARAASLAPGAALDARWGWNATFHAYPCGADVSPCPESRHHDAPPGPHVVDVLLADAPGRGRAALTVTPREA